MQSCMLEPRAPSRLEGPPPASRLGSPLVSVLPRFGSAVLGSPGVAWSVVALPLLSVLRPVAAGGIAVPGGDCMARCRAASRGVPLG